MTWLPVGLAMSAALLLVACMPQGAAPTASDGATQYVCTDGTVIPVLQGTDGNVRVTVKGENYNLIAEESASGARYGWPSDGSNYVWWTKGDTGTLYWKDGTKGGKETVLHADCKAQ